MNVHEFRARVEAHPELQFLGIPEGCIHPRVLRVAGRFEMEIPFAELKEHKWIHIEAVLTGREPPHGMTHLARIVGYYSRPENWNASKIAELRDRHVGNYAIPEGQYKWEGAHA